MYKTSLDWASQNPNMDGLEAHEDIPAPKSENLLAIYGCMGTESQYSSEMLPLACLVNILIPIYTRSTN